MTENRDGSDGIDRCKSCGTPWILHCGIQQTCSRYEIALNALRAIAEFPTDKGSRVARKTLRLLRHCK